MYTMQATELGGQFQKVIDLAAAGETVLVSSPANRNVVVLSEAEYKALKNARYLAKLERSMEQARTGRVIIKTMEELEAMAE